MLRVTNLRCEYRENPIGIDVLNPRISWIIESDQRNILQVAYQIQVAADDCSFDKPLWDTGKVYSGQSVHVEYKGPALMSRQRCCYRVCAWDNQGNSSDWSQPAFWEMGLLDKAEWAAHWIIPDLKTDTEQSEPCPMLRTDFMAEERIKSARIYGTSLGLYQLSLNGSNVGDALFTPGFTSYNKHLQYQTYDVTPIIKGGPNTLGIMLGDGWYRGDLAWKGKRNTYGDRIAALVQLYIQYEDGRTQLVVSDGSWKWSAGPILMSEIYHGETYDARLEMEGWNTYGFDDSSWRNVKILDHEKDMLAAQSNVFVKKIEELNPIGIIKTPAGETVIDMGQNMVGWVRFRVKGEKGSKVVLEHAEVLDGEGNFYTENLRSAKQRIEYILNGNGEEIYEPHFTFQGFRYIKVEEYPVNVTTDCFTGVVIHSDMERIGDFECSDPLINQLQHNILWGQKGNFLDVPTDCPQRDERLGWTGDAQVFARTACFNMNAATFFTKWLKDLKADQRSDGGVPFVVPHVLGDKDYSSAAWGDAAIVCPYTVYLCYGDERILEEQYDSMKAWVEYIRNQGESPYLWNTGFHFGDWLGLDSKEGSYVGATAKDLIATAFYANSTRLLATTARILNKIDDEKEYRELYTNIVSTFRKEFVTPSGRLAVPTQTAHVLALMFDLLEEKDKNRAVNTLIQYLEENGCHLTTGFVGAPYLCHVLSKAGKNDIAYKLLMQADYPSWLYQITKGATTIWEHWDGIKADGTFWSPDMNSFNHYAYGSIGDWLYQVAAGIDADEEKPGYKHIIINPQPGGNLEYVKAELKSMYGIVKSEWKIDGSAFQLNVTIPHNTTATVMLPGAQLRKLSEEIDSKFIEKDGRVIAELGSGSYSFSYEMNA